MAYRHFAVDALLGKRDHFRFLAIMCGGEKISAPGMGDFFLRIDVVRIADVVHQIANLPDLGLVRVCLLYTSRCV